MRKQLAVLAILPIALVSCQKEEAGNATGLIMREGPCAQSSVNLMAGQHINIGSVLVSNDEDNLYVSFSTSGNWKVKQTHLYVGACNGIPSGGGGNPKIGNFPYKASHGSGTTSFTYTIPLSAVPQCGCVAAHAEAIRLNGNGSVAQGETAWGQGERMGKSWAMKFDYCSEECEEEEEDEEEPS